MNNFAKFLKASRKQLKLKRSQVAAYAGVSPSIIKDLENEFFEQGIRLSVLNRVLAMFGATVGVIDFRENPPIDYGKICERSKIPNKTVYNISEFIAIKRKEKQLTQVQLAEESGCGLRQIRRIEQNPDEDCNISTLKKILLRFYCVLAPVKLIDAKDMNYDRSWIGSWNDGRMSKRNSEKLRLKYETARARIGTLKTELETSSSYDPKQVSCYIYRTGGDFRVLPGGVKVDMTLSNMTGGYPIALDGLQMPSTEHWYQMGHFISVNQQGRRVESGRLIQEGMLSTRVNEKGKTVDYARNAYRAKHDFMKGYNLQLIREDLQSWRTEYMLYLNCLKCLQHPDFRRNLMQIPLDAIIIEDSTVMAREGNSGGFWGTVNDLQNEAKRVAIEKIERTSAGCTGVPDFRRKVKSEIKEGCYTGVNCMGKILTIIKLCLQLGVEFPIDYDKLNNAGITVMDKRLHFEKLENISE